jgi:aryl-alcohol dehydrogenase-like predicted oxidoreductase
MFNFPRSRIVVATKVFYTVTNDPSVSSFGSAADSYVNQNGLSRKHIFDAVDASLERLDLDYIDLYQASLTIQAIIFYTDHTIHRIHPSRKLCKL